MSDLVHMRLQLPYPHSPEHGPGWTDLYVREGTSDEDVIEEIFVQDVYRVRGLDLTPRVETVAQGIATTVPGANVLDLGANIGAFAALCVQYGAERVVAVEPEPTNYELLRRNVAKWGPKVETIKGAVGARDERLRVIGEAGTAYTVADDNRSDGTTTTAQPLASLIAMFDLPITLLKCDVEGAEYEAFLSCPIAAFQRVDRIAMEWHGPRMAPHLDEVPIGDLVHHLLPTYNVQVFGDPSDGGMLHAVRYGI